jgi:hypothetical protein
MNRTTTVLGGLGSGALLLGLLAALPVALPLAPASVPAARAGATAGAKGSKPLAASATQAFWRQYNLSSLWQLQPGSSRPLNGFFGREGFRIELALLSVRRDAQQPQLYHVQGKSRCLKNLAVPFHGTIQLRQVYQAPADGQNPSYTVVGSFAFTEAPIARNTGTYRGTFAADLALVERGRLDYGRVEGSKAGGCGYKFDGQWRSTEGNTEPVVWGQDWRTLGEQFFGDFMMGDRTPSINRKYAERGWNRYWENDEWWADSPGATAQIGW